MSISGEVSEFDGILHMYLPARIRTGPFQKEMRWSVRIESYYYVNRRVLLNAIYIHTDVDECVETRDICENGRCINTEGGVICECPVGYRLSDRPNSLRCIDVREEQCYDNYRRGQCTFPREGGMTKKHCCCTMGKAWGRYCEQCPPENSGKWIFLRKLNVIFSSHREVTTSKKKLE